jgi:hypothetical protein
MECVIAWGAASLKPYITEGFLALVNKIVGVVFIAFSIALFFY